MSAAQISDLELDRLLGEVPSPPPPAADLADRIAARALSKPQERASRFSFASRHRPRRRATLWTAVVAANLVAAVAAAASWDGRRFDFHRLADLPNRVAVAVHIDHHHRENALVAQRKAAPAKRIAPPVQTATAAKVEVSGAEPGAPRAIPLVMPPTLMQPRLDSRETERPHAVQRETAPIQSGRRLHPFQQRVKPAPKIARTRPPEQLPPATATAPELSQRRVEDAARPEARVDRSAVSGEQRRPAAERNASAAPPEKTSPPQTMAETAGNVQSEWRARRFERWRNRFFKREHPHQSRNRFRRRF